MKSVLELLISGRLVYADRRVEYSAEYDEVSAKMDAELAYIESQLSDESKRRLNDMLSLHTHLLSIGDEEMKISAFRLGVLFMVEIYSGKDNLLRDN